MIRPRLNELQRSTWLRLEDDVQRFESAWSIAQSADRPDIHAFLASCSVESDEQRQALLLELILAEFEFRGREGEAVEVDGYLDRFAELRDWPEAVAELRRAARNTSAALRDTASVRRKDTRNVVAAPPELDGFESLLELGRGGMGVVYRALQTTPRRTVAVKMIRNSHLASDAEKEQFRREAEAAGRLQHPHIVPIYEVGRHAGQPYFVMELVEGENLADLSRDKPLEPRLSARYICQAAEAIQYAHEQGVVHRDVKPANLLVDRHDNIRVTDFGLARDMTDVDQPSMTAMEIGTPAYMPPEQTGVRKWGRVGPHSDIYSLGATLYDLLVGRPPFQAASAQETLWQVSEQDVPSPRLLNPKLDRDLETICLKCLERDSRRRYESARALADDLRSYLEGKPIQARPIGRVERVIRWTRRNKMAAAMLAMLIFMAIGNSIGMLVYRELTRKEHQVYVEAVIGFQTSLYAWIGGEHANEGRVADALIWFDRGRGSAAATTGAGFASQSDANPTVEKPSWSAVSNDDLLCLMSGWRTALGTILPHDGGVTAAVFSPDSRIVGTASRDGVARLWTVADGTPLGEPLRHDANVYAVAFSPDGKLVATGSADKTAGLWNAATGHPLFNRRLIHHDKVTAVAFSPDGNTLATATRSALCLWEVSTATLRWKVECQASETGVLLFTPDSRQVVASRDPSTFGIWAVADGESQGSFPHELRVMSAAISPDGTRLATGTYGSHSGADPPQLSVWALKSGTRLWNVQSQDEGHRASIQALAFTWEGELLSGANDGLVAVWNADEGKLLVQLPHDEPVRHIAVRRPAGPTADAPATFLTACSNGDAFLWEFHANVPPRRRNIRHPAAVTSASFSPDRKWVLTGGDDGTVRLIEVDDHRFVAVESQAATIALHPSRNLVAVGCVGSNEPRIEPSVRLWDLDRNNWDGEPLKCDNRVSRVAFSADGKRLLACSDNGTLTVWNTSDRKRVFEPRLLFGKDEPLGLIPFAMFSPNGRLIYGIHPRGLQELNAETGEATGVILEHAERVRDADFSRDGQGLLTAGSNHWATLWKMTENRPQRSFEYLHPGSVLCVAFAPDGQTFATGCSDNYIRIWSTTTEQLDGRPMRHDEGQVLDLVYSPDGRTLYSGGENYLAYAWNVSTRMKSSPPRQHVQRIVQSLAVTRDGRQLLTGSGFPSGGGEGVGSLNVWDLPIRLVDPAERTTLWVEVRTARRWDDELQSVKPLSFNEWNDRRRELSRRAVGK